MEQIPFSERPKLIGRKVRVLTMNEVLDRFPYSRAKLDAYRGILGREGVIVDSKRLSWADKEELPYKSLTIRFPDQHQLSHCSVEMLELLDEEDTDGEQKTVQIVERVILITNITYEVTVPEHVFHESAGKSVEDYRYKWREIRREATVGGREVINITDPIGQAFNDPRVPCCGRDIADCDCEDNKQ